ncbi:hypothetical protein V1478_004481 [Vespula squamosa]|uniref:Uncharacterized protein n=1 Tax=Vespula squamosa TaxID=30214 RepID=A0ABD2BH75_VESSQ
MLWESSQQKPKIKRIDPSSSSFHRFHQSRGGFYRLTDPRNPRYHEIGGLTLRCAVQWHGTGT